MKNIVLALLVFGILGSCTKKDVSKKEAAFSGVWKLVEMTGGMINSQTTGSAMSWQETYTLKSDRTFVKSRTAEGNTTKASGTYEIVFVNNEKLLEFTFNSNSQIIGNCYGNLKETMLFQSKKKFSGTWNACDGPGLLYEWVK